MAHLFPVLNNNQMALAFFSVIRNCVHLNSLSTLKNYRIRTFNGHLLWDRSNEPISGIMRRVRLKRESNYEATIQQDGRRRSGIRPGNGHAPHRRSNSPHPHRQKARHRQFCSSKKSKTQKVKTLIAIKKRGSLRPG